MTGSYTTGKSRPTRATLSGISIWTSPHGQWRASRFFLRILRQPSSPETSRGPLPILCPTIKHNKTYQNGPWIWSDPEVYVIDPGERLHDCLCAMYQVFQGKPTLYITDDCSASKALTKKKDMLSELAFSGRHAGASVWVLTQKYNAVLKDLREQTHWVAMFHCKDRDSFEDALCKNDVIPSHEERAEVRQLLGETSYGKLLLKTNEPAEYHVLCWVKLCWA